MSNLKIAFYSWLSTSTMLLSLSVLTGTVGAFTLLAIFFTGLIALIALIGLVILQKIGNALKCAKKMMFLIKLIYTILFYMPFFLLLEFDLLFTVFVFSSFISTSLLISFQYKHLLKTFSINKNFSIMEQEQFTIQHPEQRENHSNYIIKGVILLVMGLILFLSTFLVKNIIYERESTKALSQDFFEKSWGAKQVVAGPYLCIPYKDAKGNIFYAYLMPKDLSIDNQLQTEKRKKGIFENIVYRNQIKSRGYFDTNDIYELNTGQRLLLEQALICYGIEQISALDGVQKFRVNKQDIDTRSGLPTEWIGKEGLSAEFPVGLNQKLEFDIEISLKGTEGIDFLPLGKNSHIDIASNWHSPSFQGKYIPNEKPNIHKDGFTAQWKVQHFNKTFPQFWLREKFDPKKDAFGVDLKIPVNNYVKSERTIKYAALVIGLIFLIFFIIEINNKQNIHAIQYLLVGFSLCLFYGLLISFSELMDFNISYLIASVMTVSMISVYIYSVLKQMKFGIVTGLSLGGIYAYLYIILQQEDYALLIGNLGLFAILAIIMYFTRKIQFSLN